jgi:hypothetical protein
VWIATRVSRLARIGRMWAFFGVNPDAPALIILPRHASSPRDLSVHRDDATTVVELAAMILNCGGRPELVGNDEAPRALGETTELCVGGPEANKRSADHLRLLLPGVHVASFEDTSSLAMTIGSTTYAMDGDTSHVLVARIGGTSMAAPVFLIAGQLAAGNRAGARHLVDNHRTLARRYGTDGRFALVLHLRGAAVYGPGSVVDVEDVTADAFG